MLRILRTTSFRFTLIYVVLFASAVALLGVYLYNATFGEAAKQTDAVIDSEISVLADLFSTSGSGMLTRVIRQRTAWSDDAIYMLIGAPSGAVLAGNLTALPPEALTAEGGFFNFKFEKPLVDAAGREVGIQQREARGKMMRFRASADAEQSYLVVVARDVASREFRCHPRCTGDGRVRRRHRSDLFAHAAAAGGSGQQDRAGDPRRRSFPAHPDHGLRR